jgi:hypothetical protein
MGRFRQINDRESSTAMFPETLTGKAFSLSMTPLRHITGGHWPQSSTSFLVHSDVERFKLMHCQGHHSDRCVAWVLSPVGARPWRNPGTDQSGACCVIDVSMPKDARTSASSDAFFATMRFCSLLIAVGLPIPGLCDEAGSKSIDPSETERIEFFEKRIRPVLVEHCYSCHSAGAKEIKGGLQLDSREAILAGGDSGPALVPGDPQESLLLQALKHESLEMPPDRRLPDTLLEDFAKWIRDGAVDPRTGGKVTKKTEIDMERGRLFWAFQPVRRTNVPQSSSAWPVSDIDRFVAAAATPDVQFAVDAAPEVVVRRLTYVLTGLVPTLEQQAEFLDLWNRDPDAAVAETVDQLLESPRYGERWGRHWLDVARFAESTGGGRSMMMPDAWRFRDYVIRSFNADKPFDQMIHEHLAGDLLPAISDEQHDEQLIGSGYLMLGAINYEEQDKEALRMDVVDEQIDSMGRSFLGMTLGCARCHDHKFDPVPTADYYALAGIFRSTKSLTPGNVCGFVTAPLKSGVDQDALTKWTTTDLELEQQIASLKTGLKRRTGDSRALSAAELPGIVVDDSEAVLEGEWKASSFQPPYIGAGYQHSQQPRAGLMATYEVVLPADGEYSVRMAFNAADSRSAKVPVEIFHADGESIAFASQKTAPPGDGVFFDLGRYRFEAARPARVVVSAADASPGYVIIDAFQFLSVNAVAPTLADADEPSDADSAEDREQRLKELENQRKSHQKKKPDTPIAMCVVNETEPADWHLHVRGEIRNLGPVVPRGFLTVATPPAQSPLLKDHMAVASSGRKELANWVVSSENPLTARVYVNRVWKHVIGEGIVRTPDNFGETGERPTHPELLDYLAATFMDDGWSTKKLIRRLCTSRVFRLSSEASPQRIAADPDNRHLLRAFRRRVDAESLRDSLLQLSGALNLEVTSGRTIAKISTYDNEYRHDAYPMTVRSVFVPSFRNTMLDLFEVFDGANPNLVAGQRTVSTRPAQALFLMNSPFVMEQSQLAAAAFLKSSAFDPTNPEGSLKAAWKLCLCREPFELELSPVLQLLGDQPDSPAVWTDVFHSLFASLDFRHVR